MQVPAAYKKKQDETPTMIKKPTYIDNPTHHTEEKVPQWTDKLNLWKMQQLDEGNIKSTDKLKTEMF